MGSFRYRPTPGFVVAALTSAILVVGMIAHGPVRANDPGPITGTPHTPMSALQTNITFVVVSAIYALYCVRLIWIGGALARAGQRDRLVLQPLSQISCRTQVQVRPNESLEVWLSSDRPESLRRVTLALATTCDAAMRTFAGHRSYVLQTESSALPVTINVQNGNKTEAHVTLHTRATFSWRAARKNRIRK